MNETSNNMSANTTEIKALIEKYKQSIDNADIVLASKFWAPTDEVTFIHPRGMKKGGKKSINTFIIFRRHFF